LIELVLNSLVDFVEFLFAVAALGVLVFLICKLIASKRQSGSSFTVNRASDEYEKLVADIDMKYFDDIVGLEGIKTELRKFIKCFSHRDELNNLGIQMPRGILLYGPPGCGKTLLAKAVAREANVSFISRNAADLIGGFESSARIDGLFADAKKLAPCIVFIDELDILGARYMGMSAGTHQGEVTRLLAQMDGFQNNDGILVIGATNDMRRLDSALLRSGRFGRKFYVGKPMSNADILALVEMYATYKNFDPKLTSNVLATVLRGLSPADIKELLNRCAADSYMSEKPISRLDIEKAIIELNMETNITVDNRGEYLRRLCAWHEAGHAVVAKYFDFSVTSVSIFPGSNGIGGITNCSVAHDEDAVKALGASQTTYGLKGRLAVFYGGLCAELLYVGGDRNKLSCGAVSDMEGAAKLAHDMTLSFPFWNDTIICHNNDLLSCGKTLTRCFEEGERLLEEAQGTATQIVEANRDLIERMAEVLVEKTILMDTEVSDFLKLVEKSK